MNKKITAAKIARDIRRTLLEQPSFLSRMAGHEEPDYTAQPPNKSDFRHIVEHGHYGDEMGYRVLYMTYWRTVTITSALMASPSVLGESYLPIEQVKRMSQYLLRQYEYAGHAYDEVKYKANTQ
jgi:hypothetical protein